MSNDIFDQKDMLVGIEEYDEGDDVWDDRYECGCCMCCGCTCHDNWELEDIDELPS